MSLGLGKACAWNMDSHRGRSLVAFGYNGECHVYHIKRIVQKNLGKTAPKGQAVQRKQPQNQSKAERHQEGQTGGIDNFKTQREAVFRTDTKKFQKGVRFSPNGQRLACAGSDGLVLIFKSILRPKNF